MLVFTFVLMVLSFVLECETGEPHPLPICGWVEGWLADS